MLQYIPVNWPYDGAGGSAPGNKTKDCGPSGCFLIVLQPKAAAKRQFGCFKARQLAYLAEQRMNHRT
ncbi:MAG TPA: hypothetical protein PKA28_08250 [Methylomusa anaerophila]|uniref:Uncharacterized protein n=1 Tax=Methylomusa anaerophila TaxID=1930071 RepID=A0A348AL95_9FIRM|nr:hypothetical protein [Methylomusa anaerophila]BBB91843.1 hypothetical protein MAMMFC1_02528 [Methylomusa anaerophila]HML88424.1 hypothetical protein [Methylomusa anaerophila]